MVSRRVTVPLDAEGVARLPGVGLGKHRVQVKGEGFFPKKVTAKVGVGETKEVAVELTHLAPPISITGVALDEEGTAIAGLEISTSTSTGYIPQAATTDAQGRFTCTGLQPGKVTVIGSGTGYERANVNRIAPDVPARIRIHSSTFAPWTTEGTVVDADGAPVADAVVSLSPAILMNRMATTDAAGRFELKHLPGGPLEVAIMAAGHEWESQKLDLSDTHDDVSLVLQLSR